MHDMLSNYLEGTQVPLATPGQYIMMIIGGIVMIAVGVVGVVKASDGSFLKTGSLIGWVRRLGAYRFC